MRLWLGVGVVVVAAFTATGASGVSGGDTLTAFAGTGTRGYSGDGGPAISAQLNASGSCSKATAIQVATQLGVGVDSAIGKTPIFQVLCGSFLGRGSQGMVASVAAPTGCGGSIGWAVFRFAGGAWQLVMKQPNGALLSKVGSSDIRERVGAPRPGDPPCTPSAWTTRIWHWNGTRFAASAWKQVAPGTATAPSGAGKSGHFKMPSGNIFCAYSNDKRRAGVECVIKSAYKPPLPRRAPGCSRGYWVSLGTTGGVQTGGSVCPGEPDPQGPFIGVEQAWVLGYGKTWSGAGLRCMSAITGLTCRNKSGHGFFLSRERWRAF